MILCGHHESGLLEGIDEIGAHAILAKSSAALSACSLIGSFGDLLDPLIGAVLDIGWPSASEVSDPSRNRAPRRFAIKNLTGDFILRRTKPPRKNQGTFDQEVYPQYMYPRTSFVLTHRAVFVLCRKSHP